MSIENTEEALITFMAKEFLESRLGVDATPENVRRFTDHIMQFEQEIVAIELKKQHFNVVSLTSAKNIKSK